MENSEKKTVSRKVIDREVIMRKYHVHIKNFRNLKDVKVTLSPLTILTGENGSGKSTLFKALLFLKHNHNHEAAKKLKYVIDDDINLGGWEHIANDPKKPISIKITEETWGYDHEVEEIYDIDNCPFELNPTEEYAEKFWESFSEERTLGSKRNVIKPIVKKSFLKRNSRKTKCENVFEFIFSDLGLGRINISHGNEKLTYSLSYAVRPFTDEVLLINSNLLPPDQSEYYLVIENTSIRNMENPDILQNTISKVSFEYLLQMVQVDREIFRDFNPRKAILRENSLKTDSLYLKYFGLFVYSWSDLALRELILVTNGVKGCVALSTMLVNDWLQDIVAFGTTRELPQPHYFNSQIKEATYYKMFSVIRENNNTIDFYDNWVLERYISTFNMSMEFFELGKRLELEEGDLLTTLKLITISNNKVLLSEASSGTLQLLPILFTLAFNPNNKSIYFIQQPELHLHPRLQAQLCELWMENLSPEIKNRETDIAIQSNGGRVFGVNKSFDPSVDEIFIVSNASQVEEIEKNNKGTYFIGHTVPTHLIIETHSEHLLKKLQVLVSQGKTLQLWPEGHCSGEDVKLKDALSIYYFAKDKNGNTKAIEMELDDNGFFKTETPKGFFDESLELNRQLLLGRN